MVSYAKEGAGNEWQGSSYASYFTFQNFSPPLALMRLPNSTPSQVQDGVDRAAAVLFVDPGLAATALRLVVEQFLTTQGIPDRRQAGGYINADERIKTWQAAASDRSRVAGLLLAVKWIGNAGTHSLSTLTITEVLDGVEFLNEAFHALFVGPDIDARARAINEAKGPVPPPPAV
ncbi:DUF4145 domain-containing protein [Aeromicrobium sp. P5_D10]